MPIMDEVYRALYEGKSPDFRRGIPARRAPCGPSATEPSEPPSGQAERQQD